MQTVHTVGKMADIRCQMCGKFNPDDLVECKHCGARLKPLIAPPLSNDDSGTNWANASQEDTLSWLRGLGQDEENQESGLGLDDTDDLPDWPGSSSTQIESASSGLDWMDDVRGNASIDSGALRDESVEETPGSGSLPSWLSIDEEEVSEQNPSFVESPEMESPSTEDDWLNTLSSEDSLTATVSLPDWAEQSKDFAPEEQLSEDLPGRLAPSPQEVTPEPDDFDDDLPSWLKSGESSLFEQKTQLTPESPSDTELDGEFPDWLDSLSRKTGMTGKLGEMPEWLDENEPSLALEKQDEADEEGTLDWLATLGDVPEEESGSEDWGAGVGSQSGSVGTVGGLTLDSEDSFISAFDKGETPDWLESLQGSEVDYLETSDTLSEIEPSSWGLEQTPELEDWQDTERPPQEPVRTLSPEDSDISGGLPSWVNAFRPIDGADIATEYTEGKLERIGPLAGLRGLLNPEADIAKTTKPPTYSDSLQVSSSQHANAQLLQSLIETESVPQSIPDVSPLSSQRILRVIIGIVLILTMVFPLISGTENIPLPTQPLPQEIQSIWNLSNSAPLDRPVLVSMDFDPGMSGELEVAAAAVFDQLMARGVPLAIVSTSPVGAGLGERQVAYLQSNFPYDHHYVYGEDYVNLGYIAGGTAGLANFALIPRQSVVMAYDSRPIWELLDLDAGNPWLSPVMKNITLLKDFPMTIILTDSPDIARNWVEQVEPHLQDNALTMIVSAQAEPFVRPYLENTDPTNRQLEGLLVGLRGGASYEQAKNSSFLGRLYWDAFGVGVLVAVLLILAGGGFNYLDQLNKTRRQARKSKPRK